MHGYDRVWFTQGMTFPPARGGTPPELSRWLKNFEIRGGTSPLWQGAKLGRGRSVPPLIYFQESMLAYKFEGCPLPKGGGTSLSSCQGGMIRGGTGCMVFINVPPLAGCLRLSEIREIYLPLAGCMPALVIFPK